MIQLRETKQYHVKKSVTETIVTVLCPMSKGKPLVLDSLKEINEFLSFVLSIIITIKFDLSRRKLSSSLFIIYTFSFPAR